MRLLSTMLLLIGASACSVLDPRECTLEARSGLGIIVKDERGTTLCGATVEAIDGDYVETLSSHDPNACSYHGAVERPGKYRIEVSKCGYLDGVIENVEVEDDGCHVVAQSRTINLADGPECTE